MINYARVKLARDSRRTSQRQLALMADIPQARLSRIERGEVEASTEEIRNIAFNLRYATSFFSKKHGVQPLPPHFYRRKRTLGVGLLHEIEARFNIVLDNIEDMLSDADYPEVGICSLDRKETPMSISDAVASIKSWLRIPRGPISNMAAVFDRANIIVVPFDFGTQKIDAVSVLPKTKMPPVVFVNSKMPPDRIRFSLAHELGHLVLHSNDIFEGPTMEDEANEFASEFLLPAIEVKSSLRRLNLDRLAALKRFWGVSMGALLYRGLKLKTISKGSYVYLLRQFDRINEPVQINEEWPRLLTQLVEFQINELGNSVEDLAGRLGLCVDEFSQIFLYNDHQKPISVPKGILTFPGLNVTDT